jgi:serine/threonine-protein kinase
MGRLARVEKRDAGRVGGRYRLDEQLGTGGMSVVWRGYDEVLGREVAVKVLSAQLADDRTFRDRLRQEALSAARLCHPHITGIFDYGESPVTVDGHSDGIAVPYVVMELNDGESVSNRLVRRGPLPWREAVAVAGEVASALATAHARGVVHRDVTPANVMLTSAGAKVVDFGISALIGERDAAPDGSLLGTPAYLAPERLSGGHVSPATDVYALGLLLYRSLTGRLPWRAESTSEALRAHLYADPEPIPSHPQMPASVADLCLSCLRKSPADRPDAATVAQDLAVVLGRQAIIVPLPSSPATSSLPDRLVRAFAVLHGGLRTGGPGPRTVGLRTGDLRGGDPGPLDSRWAGRWRRALRAGHRRVHAAAATVTLLAVVGVAWVSSQDHGDVGPAQAAAAGPGPVVAVEYPTRCRARYQVRRDAGSTFDVSLAVTAIGQHPVEDWLLEFSFPGNQRLSSVSGPVGEFEQVGKKIAMRAAAGSVLQSGRAQEIFLHGTYEQVNPLPFEFALDGRQCAVMVLGTAVVPPPVADTDEPTPVREATTTGSSGSGTSGSAAGAPKSPAKSPKRAAPKASAKKSAKAAAPDEQAVAPDEPAIASRNG